MFIVVVGSGFIAGIFGGGMEILGGAEFVGGFPVVVGLLDELGAGGLLEGLDGGGLLDGFIDGVELLGGGIGFV
jgi:hypothetical protein